MDSLRLFDMPDRELLFLIEENAGGNGWTTADDIVKVLNLGGKNPTRSVASRLTWLKRYGAVEHHESKSAWRCSPRGRAIMRGELSLEQIGVLDDMSPEQMLLLTRYTTGRFVGLGMTGRQLMRREWRYGTERR